MESSHGKTSTYLLVSPCRHDGGSPRQPRPARWRAHSEVFQALSDTATVTAHAWSVTPEMVDIFTAPKNKCWPLWQGTVRCVVNIPKIHLGLKTHTQCHSRIYVSLLYESKETILSQACCRTRVFLIMTYWLCPARTSPSVSE